jgi:enoyl-CoA hydratase
MMPVSLTIENDVALIRMDDGKANAINFDMLAALNDALDKAEAGAKAIVLAGRDGRFSGGFDLKAFATIGADGVAKMLDQGGELLLRLYGGPLPVVAACTGHAIAMGTFILLACDTRVGADGDFKIGANETINGMNLPIFALELARARLSPAHMTRAMVQAFIYDPKGAVEAGFLDMAVAPEAVEAQALAIAGQLALLPTGAYAWNKTAMRKATLDRINASIGAHHAL